MKVAMDILTHLKNLNFVPHHIIIKNKKQKNEIPPYTKCNFELTGLLMG